MTVQSMDTTKVPLGETTSFIGATYRSMGEELLIGVETTAVSLRATPAWETAQTWSTRHSLQSAEQTGECPLE